MKKQPNYFHALGDTVLYKGQKLSVVAQMCADHKNPHFKEGTKAYKLKNAQGDIIRPSRQKTQWIREAYIMTYFDFDKR